MQQIWHYCKNVLSRKETGFIIIIIAVLIKILLQVAFFSIQGDKAFQLVAAKNLLDGHGLTFNYVSLNDLSTEKFSPLIGWPPGYSLVLTPLL